MTTPEESNPIRKLIGLILLAVSGLWIALCGLCGVWMIGLVFLNDPLNFEIIQGILTVVVISGFGVGSGYIFWRIGRSLNQ